MVNINNKINYNKSPLIRNTSNKEVQANDFDFQSSGKISYKIESWKLQVINPNGDEMEASGVGSALNANAKNAIKSITTGGMVYFSNIKASGPDGVVRNIPPYVVYAN